eukprot:Nitzschia sp. Nitz4//scaffold129_size63868//7961//13582//NITZ4_006194-RA/size63868-processed-gene-0.27-mRNA-1//1//CDS//3329534890//9310//frame0
MSTLEESSLPSFDCLSPRPVQLKLDVASSCDSEEFVQSPAESPTSIEGPSSMETACQLVHSLLDQVTWNDDPPLNEEVADHPGKKGNSSPRHFSRQCHIQTSNFGHKEPMIKTSASEGSDKPSDLWKEQYNIRCNPAEQRMGNVALSTLCARTLQTIGKPSRPTKEAEGRTKNPPLSVNTSHNKSPRWQKKNHSPRLMTWGRRRSKKKEGGSPHFGEIVVTQPGASPPKSRKNSKLNKNAHSSLVDQENGTAGVRLQMFGSEYARHLSTTALAPKDVTSRPRTIPRANLNGMRRKAQLIQNIEDAELSVLTGPITDLVITVGECPPPRGYYRISQSAGGERFFLRDRKTPAYINVKKETNWDRAAQRPCVTALALVFPQKKEFVPPGFSVVRSYSPMAKGNDRNPANLNLGDEHIFLCFRRSREGNPITSILPLLPSKRESIPEGFTVLEHTPRNHVASIQTQSSMVFLAYRQRLANLEVLRPLPLVMSVHSNSATASILTAYYCTGGTVVESRVGRFHVMDRSTHSLLSPSSINNRLSLIEASRRKTMNNMNIPTNGGSTYAYSGNNPRKPTSNNETLTSSLLLAHGLGTPGSRSVVSDLERMSSSGDQDSEMSFDTAPNVSFSDQDSSRRMARSINITFSSNDEDSIHPQMTTQAVKNLYCAEDKDLERCLEALSFIPVVSTAVNERNPKNMLHFQARVTVLTPVLTACYTRHGGAALLAVEGLTELLQSDFFTNDVNLEQDSISRITLLDIAIQVVCDVAMMGTQETHMHACVEFVDGAVKYGCGHLNTRTVGYVLRFYLFVFYFGVTTPSGSTGSWGSVNGQDHFLLEDPRSGGSRYLPGGAPQASLLSMKELITFSIGRLRLLVESERLMFTVDTPREDQLGPDIFNDMINSFVNSIVDKSVHRVDIANYTQLALHQINRSGGSELFWYDMMNSCGLGLFGSDNAMSDETKTMYSMVFAMLAHCVKIASAKIRMDKNSEGVPRDIASKLASLEMLQFFLVKWDESKEDLRLPNSNSFDTFIFAIRRLVVPCLLANTREAIDNPRVYRRILQIIGVLWCSETYRSAMKLELGILMDHFVLTILKLGPQILYKHTPQEETKDPTYLFAHQIELMKSLQNWFSDSRCLLELILNYDTALGSKQVHGSTTESLAGVQWQVAQKICSALCILAENCGEFIAQQIRESRAASTGNHKHNEFEVIEGVSGTTLARESAQRLRQSCFDTLALILHYLAESAAVSHGPKHQALIDVWGSRFGAYPTEVPSIDSEDSGPGMMEGRQGRDAGILGFWQKAIVKKEEKEAEMVALLEEAKVNEVDNLAVAFDIGREKGLRKAVDYLIACNVLSPSPRDIASFLRLHRSALHPVELGKYLGEGGTDGSETEYWNLIRFSYIRAISFVGMGVEQGLRHLLTNGGFRLPGEAQQVDRLITTFSQCYWEDNAGDVVNCPFHDQDTVFLLSFAIIMLNTDLHKASVVTKKNSNAGLRKKMTKPEFINNLKGSLGKSDELSADYLSCIYDSIEKSPIILIDEEEASDQVSECSHARLEFNLKSMVINAKSLDALLRCLSIHEYRYTSVEDYSRQVFLGGNITRATSDLCRKLMLHTWHQFHGLINACLESAHLDLKGLESCTPVLKYALSLTIMLDMSMERKALLGQLGRFRLFEAWRRGEAKDLSVATSEAYKSEDWYIGIEEACSDGKTSSAKGKLASLKLIDELLRDNGITVRVDAEDRKATRDAVKMISNAEYLLNEPTRVLLRSGNLMKRANRSGRLTEYRFFLFSDLLIYAKKIPGGTQFKIHEELPLMLMKIVDWFPAEQKREAKRGFQVYHPRKTFIVLASSREERGSWVSSLRGAIEKEVTRTVAIEGARKAAGKTH